MKIISKNKLPTNDSGIFAHYNHKRINQSNWKYVNVREYVGEKEKFWIENIQDWHNELFQVGINNLEWWEFLSCSRLVSWYPPEIIKPLFFAKAVVLLIEKQKIEELFLIECPKEVLSFIKELRPDIEIEQSLLDRFFPITIFFRQIFLKFFIGQQLSLMKKIVSLAYTVNIREKKLLNVPKAELAIYSHLLNKETLISKNDHFFGQIFDEIKSEKKFWIYFSSLDRKTQKDIEQYLQKKNIHFVMINNLLSKVDVIKIWIHCVKLTFFFRRIRSKLPCLKYGQQKIRSFSTNFFDQLIINHYPIDAFSVFYAFKRLLKIQNKISNVIYPYEEKGIEKAILKNCILYNIKTIGYAHAVHSNGHLYMKRWNENLNIKLRPNIIASTGPAAAKWKNEVALIPHDRIQIIGSNRYIDPFPIKSTPQDRLKCLKVLFVSGQGHEPVMLNNYLEEDQDLFYNCEIWIRKYPYHWINRQNRAIFKIQNKLKNLETKETSIFKQFEWSDVIIFSSTSAGIEAMLSGRYTINVELHDLNKINPLENKGDSSKVICCKTSKELKKELEKVKNMKQKEFLETINGQINYARQIYSPVNHKVIEQIIA